LKSSLNLELLIAFSLPHFLGTRCLQF